MLASRPLPRRPREGVLLKAQTHKSQTQRALDVLRAMILSNELPAGSTHLETELAHRLKMSRTPVREACLMLEGQGLIEVRPRRGMRINALSPDDMREIYEVLTELESFCAEEVAARKPSEQELLTLARSIKKMESALAAGNRADWAKADEEFHTELVRLSGNRRIGKIVETYNDQVRRARAITLHLRPLPTKSNQDHRKLYDALLKGDAQAARRVHRKHRVRARELLTGLLSQTGLFSI